MQAFIRKMSEFGNEVVKKIGKKPSEFFKMSVHSQQGCNHESCQCYMLYEGRVPVMQGSSWKVPCGPPDKMELAYRKMMRDIKDKFMVDGETITMAPIALTEKNYFESSIKKDCNLTLTSPPMSVLSYPTEAMEIHMDPAVVRAVIMADCLHRSEIPPEVIMAGLTTSIRPSLVSLCLDHIDSIYKTVIVHKNAKPGVLVATAGLYTNHKAANAILLQQQPFVHKLKPEGEKTLTECLNTGLDLLYNAMGTKHLFGTKRPGLSFDSLQNMYLGASKGLDVSSHREEDGVFVTGTDKKITSIESDMEAIINFLEDPEYEPAVYWNIVPKDEKFFYKTETMTDEQYRAKCEKLRLFVIGNSVMVCMERMVSSLRQKLERGDVIIIGHSWSRGGADEVARMLRFDPKNPFKPNICEGDVSHIDVSIAARFVDICMSMALVYEDPKDPDYEYRVKILKFVIKNLLCRLTHMFGSVWAFQRGGVPSGVFNTSHIDSWVMALWWYLFMAYQIMNTPERISEKLYEAAAEKIRGIFYGDDHLYTKGHDPELYPYMSAHLFATFMKEKFDVTLRDIKDGIPLVSVEKNGKIIEQGATMLKHQFVLNPLFEGDFLADGKQPMLLPYRETFDYLIRCVHGKTNKPRDVLDVALAAIGHAYGTYASNRDAYDKLKCLYNACLFQLGVKDGCLPREALDRLRTSDLRDIRRKGISSRDIMLGFPSWNVLVKKNEYSREYHIIQRDITIRREADFEVNE